MDTLKTNVLYYGDNLEIIKNSGGHDDHFTRYAAKTKGLYSLFD